MKHHDAAALEAILGGFTHYIGAQARADMITVIYYRSDQQVFAMLPGNERRVGSWSINPIGFCVHWNDREPAIWTITSAPGELAHLNADGKRIGLILKFVAGDVVQLI
jgi:hypothetical protein